jgi:hypothetical protein
MEKPGRPQAFCLGCKKEPSELDEYVGAGRVNSMSADDYCWEEEGTLNRENGHFTCTSCYIKAGMPSSSRGWVAP